MRNFRNIFTTKRNNFGFFLQLSIFVLLGIMSLVSGQVSAQTPGIRTCTPATTVTEGDLLPGGILSFGVSSGLGSVTVEHIEVGSGLQSLTMIGMPTNATVHIPEFMAGTTAPIVVTFTTHSPGLAVEFILRAASAFYAVNIRVRCAEICTPTPTMIEGDLFPGGIMSFDVMSGPGSVTISHVNGGTGMQSLTVVGTQTNATVNIPAFMANTLDPITVTFAPTDPNQEIKFTLRAANTFHAVFIAVRCGTLLPEQPADNGSKE